MDSEFERQRLYEQLEESRETIDKLQKKIKDGQDVKLQEISRI